MTEDPELLRRYASGQDNAAFAELVQRHLRLVYHTALRHVGGDAHSAQDVAQVVFADLARKAESLSQLPCLGGWLYARARHAGLAAMRSRRRRQTREEKVHFMSDWHPHSLEPDWAALRPVIDEALNRLKPPDRDAVILRFFEGRPFAEVGAKLGVSEDAARMRVERALEKLRPLLRTAGVASVAALATALASQATAAIPEGLATSVTGAALASAAAPAAGFVSLVQLITAPKLVLGGAVLAGIIGVGLSVRAWQRAEAANTALATVDRENGSLASELERLQARIHQAAVQIEGLRSKLAALRAKQEGWEAEVGRRADAASSHPADKAGEHKAPAINWELSNNPQVRVALAGWLRGVLEVQYGPLFKALGLSAQQIEALIGQMLLRNVYFNNNGLTLRPEGETPASVEQSIHELLGDAKYQQFSDYQPTMYVREVSTALAGALYDTDSPLSVQQAEQLTQVMGQNSTRPRGSGWAFPNTIDWGPVFDQAENFLSTSQLNTLENQITVLTSSPGIWGRMDPISPGSLGTAPLFPLAFLISQRPRK